MKVTKKSRKKLENKKTFFCKKDIDFSIGFDSFVVEPNKKEKHMDNVNNAIESDVDMDAGGEWQAIIDALKDKSSQTKKRQDNILKIQQYAFQAEGKDKERIANILFNHGFSSSPAIDGQGNLRSRIDFLELKNIVKRFVPDCMIKQTTGLIIRQSPADTLPTFASVHIPKTSEDYDADKSYMLKCQGSLIQSQGQDAEIEDHE